MSKKQRQNESPFETFSNEATRQRWEMFHRAIAYAKESNSAALDESESVVTDTESSGPLLTIVR